MMDDDREYRKSFADEQIETLSHPLFLFPTAFMLFTLAWFFLDMHVQGAPKATGVVADYSAVSLAHRNFEVKLDEDSSVAGLDADGTSRLGKRDENGKVRQAFLGGWSWTRPGAGADAGLCLRWQDTSSDAHCYTLSVSSGELFRPDDTRFGRIVDVSEPETAPPVSQEIRDVTGQ